MPAFLLCGSIVARVAHGAALPAGRELGLERLPALPAAPRRGTGRRARLVVSRVSPWSVVKVTFLYSICLFVILLVAVGVLWSVLNAAGVFDSVKSTAEDLTSKPNGGVAEWLSLSRVMLIATLDSARVLS